MMKPGRPGPGCESVRTGENSTDRLHFQMDLLIGGGGRHACILLPSSTDQLLASLWSANHSVSMRGMFLPCMSTCTTEAGSLKALSKDPKPGSRPRAIEGA